MTKSRQGRSGAVCPPALRHRRCGAPPRQGWRESPFSGPHPAAAVKHLRARRGERQRRGSPRRPAGVRFKCLTATRRSRPSLGHAHHPRPGGQHGTQATEPTAAHLPQGARRGHRPAFQWPSSSAAASREIQRLKNTRPSTELERAIERFGDTQAIESAQNATEIHGFEIVGHGSTCTWSQRA